MSDQELAKTLGYLRLAPRDAPNAWTCLRGSVGSRCGEAELRTRPDSNKDYVYFSFDDEIRGALCAEGRSCIPLQMDKKEANRLVFRGGGPTDNSPDLIYIYRSKSGELTGEYYTHRSIIIQDYGVSAYWRGLVDLFLDGTGPVSVVEGRWGLNPLRIKFDQRVKCDSLAVSVFDSMNRTVPFSLKTSCEEKERAPGLRGTTPSVSVFPTMAWADSHYRVVVDRATGISGVSIPNAQSSDVSLLGFSRTPASLDFEEDKPQGWYPRQSYPQVFPQSYPCRIATQEKHNNGNLLDPASGAKMLSCRTSFREGSFVAIGQIAVPPGSKFLVASLASLNSKDANRPIGWGAIGVTARVSHSQELSFPGDVSLVPDASPGWTMAKVPLPSGIPLVELKVELQGCMIPSGPNCDLDLHLAIDNIRFE